ncbi:MAG: cardiolipin synthase B, partial [Pseudomonadota bacterium]
MLILLTILITTVSIIILMNFITAEKKIQRKLEAHYDIADPQFSRSVSALLGPPFISGNSVEAFVNGNQIFPQMLEAMKNAKDTITFETFIYWSGTIGQEFSDTLSERALAGIKVHVLLDWLGSVKME